MPPKAPPQIYQLCLKTKKFAVLLVAPQSTTIAALKVRVLSALTSQFDVLGTVPEVRGVDDFEICREVKGKGQATVTYEVLDAKWTLKNVLTQWQPVFLQFRDGSGNLLPVDPPVFSLLGEYDEDEPMAQTPHEAFSPSSDAELSVRAGKRKALPE